MSYISWMFLLLVIAVMFIYYILPVKMRPYVLLAGSTVFAVMISWTGAVLLIVSSALAFIFAHLIASAHNKSVIKRRCLLIISILTILLPWIFVKINSFPKLSHPIKTFIIPIGISFYTLELVSYLADVYKTGLAPEKNPFIFMSYTMFFPKLIQGPIMKYRDLRQELNYVGRFNEHEFENGICEILFGLFLKIVIADKAALLVDPLFEGEYAGGYILLGGILYSIELYTDFLGCVMICKGVAGFFGIKLKDNFRRPYFSLSFRDFWKRWHISLSEWLTEYIYIPLGGNRKGRLQKCINILITFIVSGFWHGNGLRFILWGIIHGFYRIFEEIFGLTKNEKKLHILRRIAVSFFAMLAWIVFRASSLKAAVKMLINMVVRFNPGEVINGTFFRDTIGYPELIVLILAVLALFIKEILNENGIAIKDKLTKAIFPIKLVAVCGAVMLIIIFGTYGYGFDSADFIYGGF